MKNGALWAVIVIVLLLAFGGWWYFSMNKEAATEDTSEVAGESNRFEDGSKDSAIDASIGVTVGENVQSVTVTYGPDGFSPKTLTVKTGTKVTFVNQSGGEMWVASDVHPSHTGYSGTSRESHCPDPAGVAFDQCGAGSSFSFVFDKTGTWSYHNHRDSDQKGTIVVTE